MVVRVFDISVAGLQPVGLLSSRIDLLKIKVKTLQDPLIIMLSFDPISARGHLYPNLFLCSVQFLLPIEKCSSSLITLSNNN